MDSALVFEHEKLDANVLHVQELTGVESLSRPFRFQIELIGHSEPGKHALPNDFEPRDLLYTDARVGISATVDMGGGAKAKKTRWFGGLITEVEFADEQVTGRDIVRLVLEPKLTTILDEHWRSRVVLDSSVIPLAETVMKKAWEGIQEDKDYHVTDALAERHEETGKAALKRDVQPEREYVVQYEETDLDFLQRWLEHEGVYYFFEHKDDRERIVFGDTTGGYASLRSSFPYSPLSRAEGDGARDEVVRRLVRRVSRLPKNVMLHDYNWRTPDKKQLAAPCDVSDRGQGTHREYNDHFKTKAQGETLAKVRSEELLCREERFSGQSSVPSFRPGHVFELSEHPNPNLNQAYLLVEVRHSAKQPQTGSGAAAGEVEYENSFEAIPAKTLYRPARDTDWPVIHGVMHAFVDSTESDAIYADLDDQGRYMVRLPFDEGFAEHADGKGSRFVRMAQPFVAAPGEKPASGFHFPLRKGTEVLISHVDGDPDRPVILGAVPNPDFQSPVNQNNRHESSLTTPTGNQIVIDDQEGNEGMVLRASSGSMYSNYRSLGRTQ